MSGVVVVEPVTAGCATACVLEPLLFGDMF